MVWNLLHSIYNTNSEVLPEKDNTDNSTIPTQNHTICLKVLILKMSLQKMSINVEEPNENIHTKTKQFHFLLQDEGHNIL